MSPDFSGNQPFGNIALCLSGGGYRAATFALGTLDMLDELDLLKDVKLLSTVSGGTFTGLTYATWQSENKTFDEFYDYFSRYLKNTNAIDKALKDLYDTPSPSGSTDLSLIRSAAKSYQDELIEKRKFGQLLEFVNKDGRFKELIFNATEFREGNAFRFRASSDDATFIGNQNFSVPREVAAEIHLADIIASSSCFPGAFEPIRFPDDFYWQSSLGRIREKLTAPVRQPYPPFGTYRNGFDVDKKCIPLPLMDGGVFDNQGITSAVIADVKNDYNLFLITDTSPREDAILESPDLNPRHGWVSLETLFRIAVGLLVLSVAAIGITAYSFFNTDETFRFEKWQIIAGYVIAILPAFLLIGVLVWIYTLFLKAKTVVVSGATFRLWHYFKKMALPDAIDMIKTRVGSVMAMTTNVFMKRIRQLQFNNLMDPAARAKYVSFNLIYSLDPLKDRAYLEPLDPDLKPTEEMKNISKYAEKVATTLWMTEEDYLQLIACGRCTTCFSLLKHLWQRWLAEEAEAKKNNLKPPPKPDSPGSPHYDIYKRLKVMWSELKKDPYKKRRPN